MKKADEIFALTHVDLMNEVNDILKTVTWEELEPCDVVALAVALRPVWERREARKEHPPVPLELVRSRRRKKG